MAGFREMQINRYMAPCYDREAARCWQMPESGAAKYAEHSSLATWTYVDRRNGSWFWTNDGGILEARTGVVCLTLLLSQLT